MLEAGGPSAGSEQAIAIWEAGHGAAVQRCLSMIADIQSSGIHDTTTLPVALREVRNLVRAASGAADGALTATGAPVATADAPAVTTDAPATSSA